MGAETQGVATAETHYLGAFRTAGCGEQFAEPEMKEILQYLGPLLTRGRTSAVHVTLNQDQKHKKSL